MEGLVFGLGILLAVLGPLLLVPIVWLLYRFAARPLVRRAAGGKLTAGAVRGVALVLSVLVVGGAVLASYLPGKREFDRLCDEHATPVISERVFAEGFYRTRLYPYEADRFLEEQSFAFVEAPDMYHQGAYVRYTQPGDKTLQEEIQTLNSRYGVRENFTQTDGGSTMTQKIVYEIASGRELARAASIHYDGGPLSILLGVYATSSCPDIRTPEGSEHFRTFYNLESLVLRASRSANPNPASRSERP